MSSPKRKICEVISIIELDTNFIKEMVGRGKRLDNRELDEYRKIEVQPGIISSAEGSARVRIGSTEVIAGVKMSVGEPFPDTPTKAS